MGYCLFSRRKRSSNAAAIIKPFRRLTQGKELLQTHLVMGTHTHTRAYTHRDKEQQQGGLKKLRKKQREAEIKT